MAELNDIGALDAAKKLLEAKEEVAHIALGQLTRKPVTNMINNLWGCRCFNGYRPRNNNKTYC